MSSLISVPFIFADRVRCCRMMASLCLMGIIQVFVVTGLIAEVLLLFVMLTD